MIQTSFTYFANEGVIDVSDDVCIDCPQVQEFIDVVLGSTTKGQEDCLFLNVHICT